MRVEYYFNGKRVTKKELVSVFGEKTISRLLKDAKDTYKQDPNISLAYANGVSFRFII